MPSSRFRTPLKGNVPRGLPNANADTGGPPTVVPNEPPDIRKARVTSADDTKPKIPSQPQSPFLAFFLSERRKVELALKNASPDDNSI